MKQPHPACSLLVLLLAACASTPPPAATTDAAPSAASVGVAPAAGADRAAPPAGPFGRGCDDLIPIAETSNGAGVDAEYAWLRRHYPGFERIEQRLGNCGERKVDVIVIRTPDGLERPVYFDITEFFGRW